MSRIHPTLSLPVHFVILTMQPLFSLKENSPFAATVTIIVEHFSNVAFSCILQGATGSQCWDLLFLSGDGLCSLWYSLYLGLERVLDLRYLGDEDLFLDRGLYFEVDVPIIDLEKEYDLCLIYDLVLDLV